jgi:hypothetical protein
MIDFLFSYVAFLMITLTGSSKKWWIRSLGFLLQLVWTPFMILGMTIILILSFFESLKTSNR